MRRCLPLLRAHWVIGAGLDCDGPLTTSRYRDPCGRDPQGKLLNEWSVEPRPAGVERDSRCEMASMAAHVAATPAGMKEIRLATGTSFGAAAEDWMRVARSRAAVGWVVGGRVAEASDRAIVIWPLSL